MPRSPVCLSSDISDDQSLGFSAPFNFFIVKKQGHVFGYKNSCPHVGAPLEWQANAFFNHDNSLIQCAMHGALFLPDSGECVAGPCSGQSLTPVTLIDDGQHIYIEHQ